MMKKYIEYKKIKRLDNNNPVETKKSMKSNKTRYF